MAKLERIILEITPECWDAIRVELGMREEATKREITHVWRDSLYEKYGLEKPTSAEERRRLALLEERARKAQEEFESMRKEISNRESEKEGISSEVTTVDNDAGKSEGVTEAQPQSERSENGEPSAVTHKRPAQSNTRRGGKSTRSKG